jgi:hypothetical protein
MQHLDSDTVAEQMLDNGSGPGQAHRQHVTSSQAAVPLGIPTAA